MSDTASTSNPGSDLWGAVLDFENINDRLKRLEMMLHALSSSESFEEMAQHAFAGVADAVQAIRHVVEHSEDQYAAMSKAYKEAAK